MAEKTLNVRSKQKYDIATNWTDKNPILLAGEIGIESDTNKIKVGDGTSAWNSLSYISGGSIEIDKYLLGVISPNPVMNSGLFFDNYVVTNPICYFVGAYKMEKTPLGDLVAMESFIVKTLHLSDPSSSKYKTVTETLPVSWPNPTGTYSFNGFTVTDIQESSGVFYVVCCGTYGGSNITFYRSRNGIGDITPTFVSEYKEIHERPQDMAFGNGRIVAPSQNSSIVWYSDDYGATWNEDFMKDATSGDTIWTSSCYSVHYSSKCKKFIATTRGYIMTSTDGITWTRYTSEDIENALSDSYAKYITEDNYYIYIVSRTLNGYIYASASSATTWNINTSALPELESGEFWKYYAGHSNGKITIASSNKATYIKGIDGIEDNQQFHKIPRKYNIVDDTGSIATLLKDDGTYQYVINGTFVFDNKSRSIAYIEYTKGLTSLNDGLSILSGDIPKTGQDLKLSVNSEDTVTNAIEKNKDDIEDIKLKYLPLTGGTLSGGLTISSGDLCVAGALKAYTDLNGFSVNMLDGINVGMELGKRDGSGASTPYIDFHTNGSSTTDYNVRLLASGSQLRITASGGILLNGGIITYDSTTDTFTI